MSRSPWFLLSLATPVVLGALTIAAVMALSQAPAREIETPTLDSSRAGETQDEARTSAPPAERAPALNPSPSREKAAPRSKPRVKKPSNGEGPVLYAASRSSVADVC